MISDIINGFISDVGRSDLLLSKSEARLIDSVFEKPIEKYVWLALVVMALLTFVAIVLPRVFTILWEKHKG